MVPNTVFADIEKATQLILNSDFAGGRLRLIDAMQLLRNNPTEFPTEVHMDLEALMIDSDLLCSRLFRVSHADVLNTSAVVVYNLATVQFLQGNLALAQELYDVCMNLNHVDEDVLMAAFANRHQISLSTSQVGLATAESIGWSDPAAAAA